VAGQDIYLIGSPQFSQVTLYFSPQTIFNIIAYGSGLFVQSAKINNVKLSRAWLRHDELAQGGTLEFWMGEEPASEWGDEPPPSWRALANEDVEVGKEGEEEREGENGY